MRLFKLFILLLISSLSSNVAASVNSSVAPKHSLNKTPANMISQQKLPLYFEKNQGQFEHKYQFVAHTPYSRFAFANDRVEIQLKNHEQNHKLKKNKPFVLRFENIAKDIKITGKNISRYTVNYYRGKKSQWRKNIPTFSEILYAEIYPGIDLKFYFNDSKLEYDFVVKPGADPSPIQFTYENIDAIKMGKDDILNITVNQASVQQQAPKIFQIKDGKREIVSGNYWQKNNSFGFLLSGYDKNKTLIIDPVIEFSSYFGGNWEDFASNVVTDSVGNIFLVGSTAARARITVNNIMTLEDTALTPKEGPANFGSFDGTHGISLDLEFLTGSQLDLTKGEKITEVNGVEQRESYEYQCDYGYKGFFDRDYMLTDYDAFISKFEADYTQVFTTYYGGCGNDGIRDLVVDKNDNIYIAGFTLSEDIPIKSASQVALAPSRFVSEPKQSDAFYAKFDNDGFLIYSSYLGGDGRDGARGISVDDSGYLYITGYTHSSDLRTCPVSGNTVIQCESIGGVELVTDKLGTQEISLYSDAFVAKVSPTGDALSFITYFGGSYDDWGQAIAVYDNAVYIAGNTSSPDLPAPSTGYSYLSYRNNSKLCSRVIGAENFSELPSDAHFCEDAYLAKLSLDGEQILFTTYLGGELDDGVSKMEIDHLGNIYLLGTSSSLGARLETGLALETSADSTLSSRFPLYKNITSLYETLESDDPTVLQKLTSPKVFFTVFKPNANALMFSMFVGGDNSDSGTGLSLNDDGTDLLDVYLAGHTLSDNFYITQPAFQNKTNNSELFLMKFTFDLSKRDDPYVRLADGEDSSQVSGCHKDTCDLYSIKYSTLLGGEDLDAMKDLYFSKFDNTVLMAGSTYSTMFPTTSNAIKTKISEVMLTEYDPLTREVIYQTGYYPSDMFLLKISDSDVNTDLSLDVNVTNTDTIHEGDKVNYEVTITNNGNNIASSVRINMSFSYLAADNKIANFASVSGAQECKMEYKQIYCRLEDIAASSQKTLQVALEPQKHGYFRVNFTVMSQVSDNNMANNQVVKNTRINIVPSRATMLGYDLILMLILIVIIRSVPPVSRTI